MAVTVYIKPQDTGGVLTAVCPICSEQAKFVGRAAIGKCRHVPADPLDDDFPDGVRVKFTTGETK